jgi:hypothetical protein
MYAVSDPLPPVIVTVGLVVKLYVAPMVNPYGVPLAAFGRSVSTVPLVLVTRFASVCSGLVTPPLPPLIELQVFVAVQILMLVRSVRMNHWPTAHDAGSLVPFGYTLGPTTVCAITGSAASAARTSTAIFI